MPGTSPQNLSPQITGLILAGGCGRRWGGKDKGLIELDGKMLAHHVADALHPFCQRLIISCNRNEDTYRHYAELTVKDDFAEFEGPLVGLLSVLSHPTVNTADILLCSPCDTPYLGPLYGQRMSTHPHAGKRILVARTEQHPHYLHMLLPAFEKASLSAFFDQGGRSVKRWLETTDFSYVDFLERDGLFHNLNSPDTLPSR